MRAVIPICLAALGACADKDIADDPKSGDPVSEPAPPASPSPYEYDGQPEPPVYDQAELEAAMDAVFAEVLTISGAPPILAYQTMMELADSSCPTWYTNEGYSYWVGGCTTGEGVDFSGYVFADEYVDAALLGEGSSMTGMTLNGQAFITDTDGGRLDMGGYAYDAAGTGDDGVTETWLTGVIGTFVWDDELVEDTWLGTPLQPTLEASAYQFVIDAEGTKVQGVRLHGGLAGFNSDWSTASLDSIFMVDELPGFWHCGLEPAGILSIRAQDGYWYQVAFDVQKQADGSFDTPPGTCDGCGTVYRGGDVIGEACADASVLTDWEDQPW